MVFKSEEVIALISKVLNKFKKGIMFIFISLSIIFSTGTGMIDSYLKSFLILLASSLI